MTYLRNSKTFTLILIMAFMTLLVQDLVFTSQASAQTSAGKLVNKGIQQYEDAEFELAIKSLQQALQLGLRKDRDKIKAHKHLAFCYVTVGKNAEAGKEYLKLLEIKPTFNLPISISPKLSAPFKSAQKEFAKRDTDPPAIEHTAVTACPENKPLKISATVTDHSGLAEAALFYKRTVSKKYKKIKMTAIGQDQYEAEIPGREVTPAGIAYYLQALDKVKNKPGFKGSARTPLKVKVTRTDIEPPKIAHNPINKITAGEQVELIAAVTDNVDVDHVKLFYRQQGKTQYQVKNMLKKQGHVYSTKLTARPTGIEYYLQAQDVNGKSMHWKSVNSPQLLVVQPKTKPVVVEQTPEPASSQPAKKGSKKWLWIGLGTAALGGVAILALTGSDGDKKGDNNSIDQSQTGSILIKW